MVCLPVAWLQKTLGYGTLVLMVIFQKPNKPLVITLSAFAVRLAVRPIHQLQWLGILVFILGVGMLGYWSYLEITSGVNGFRRMLGWVGMLTALFLAIHDLFY